MGAQGEDVVEAGTRRYFGATVPERIEAAIERGVFPHSRSSRGLVNSFVVSTGGGQLYGLSGYSNRGTSQFIQIFDAISVPADGAAPDVLIVVPATDNFSADWGTIGRAFYVGIVIVNSTTAATKTIGAADTFLDVQYV